MKWYEYKITLNSGIDTIILMGEWLKEGEYCFGKVEKIREMTDEEVKEYHAMEDELFKTWARQLPKDF